jgi:rhodanese-related sulfurtransferase
MKKLIYLALTVLLIISVAGCARNADNPDATPQPSETVGTDIDGRIIEIVEGEHVIIRNEEDTSIYFKIDISNGLVFSSGVNENLQPDNVIMAEVEMLDFEALPKETKLIEITGNKAPDYRVIDAEQAKAMIDEGGVIIVDVRTRVEYEEGYIPDAYNVPLDQIDKQIGNVTSDLDAKILLYCRSGNRSKVAARILTEMGYTNVYDFGGIVSWPYEIIEP